MAKPPSVTYAINFTRLARAIATTRYSLEAVEATARQELAGLEGLEDPTDIFMHCFKMEPDGDFEFVCLPGAPGTVRVDSVSFVAGDPLPSGPLAGKRLMMPVPDSDEEETS